MDDASEQQYVRLLTEHQPMLRAFVMSLLPGLPGVDDVIQEANTILWTKRHNFELGTNFRAWTLRIARFQAMAHLKTLKRQRWISLDDEAAELVANELEDRLDPQREEARIQALRGCLSRLKETELDLLVRRYWKKQRLQDFAVVTGRSINGLKVTLFRLRAGLKRCIEREIPNLEAQQP
jgi:RNA polymerase sigma-70 factor, ECF subfamily